MSTLVGNMDGLPTPVISVRYPALSLILVVSPTVLPGFPIHVIPVCYAAMTHLYLASPDHMSPSLTGLLTILTNMSVHPYVLSIIQALNQAILFSIPF